MVGKISHSSKGNFEPWRRFINKNFEPDPRLDKVEEATSDEPWYTDVHRIPLRRLLERYGSSITKGLSDTQVFVNRHHYGSNVVASSVLSSKRIWTLFKSTVLGLNSLIWICLIFSIAIFFIRWICLREKPLEHLIFAGVLLFAIIVTTVSFYFRIHQPHKLNPEERKAQCALAKRNGRFVEIPSSELVVGDIVQMTYGDVIPADIRVIEAHEFFVDNSGLTGESDPKRRRSICTNDNPMETKNLAFFSTYALEGYAKGVVVNVGENTLMGRVASVANDIDVKFKSPVQKEMDKFVFLLIVQAFLFGSFFFVVSMSLDNNWKEALVYVMTVIVANVPEGLVLTSTILVALVARRMSARSCLVKNLHSIETLGMTTCICTDKTGTITQNRMAIAHLWFDGRIAEADTSEFLDGHQAFQLDDPGFKALARVARLCSRARFKPYQMDKPIFRREVQGDASEAAILRFMEAHLGSVTKYRRKYKKICELPFNSRIKMQAFVYEIPEDAAHAKQHYLTVKGAPEKLFELCTSILIKDKAYTLDEKWKAKFHQVLTQLGSVGDRVIGLADVLLPKEKYNENYNYDTEKPEFLKVGLRFVGLLSMIDPPRATVPEAVARCKKAGVKVVMVTGDHPITATAIAKATGIFSPHNITTNTKKGVQIQVEQKTDRVYSGKDLFGIDQSQLESILRGEGDVVFARTTPEQKYMIVESLQKIGHQVTVVGDGVNDSPAIKRANVGIVMGITGSEVSKEVGDIVLLDDSFSNVVEGIEEGRQSLENLNKLLRYTMTDNIAQLYCSGISIIFRLPKPLSPMAMLLTVLGTDLFAAVSLCFEKIEKDVMKKSNNTKKQRKLITSHLFCHIYTQLAVFEMAAGFFAYFATMISYGFTPMRLMSIKKEWENKYVNDLMDDIYGQEWTYVARKRIETHCQSAFFIAIVVMQVANVLICKGHRASIVHSILNNWTMPAAILAEIALAAALLYIPRISFITGLAPIKLAEWTYAIPFAFLLISFDELRRFALRRNWIGPGLSSVILH